MQMMNKFETALFAVVVAFTALPSRADVKESWTVDSDTQLTEDVTVTGTLTVAEGATLDLNGYALTAGAVVGAGGIVDSAAAALEGYERLEYIASDGKAQYIDTEDSHNASTIVDLRIQFNTTAPQFQAYYGARTGGNASQFGGWVNYSQFRYGYGGDSASNYSVPAVNTATIYDVHLNKSGQCTVVTNGVVADVFNIGSGNGDNTTLQLTDFLFAINQGSDTAGNKSPQWHANAKIYSCVIRQNGGIAHNFIPVERLSDGKIGMYDSVTGKFHVSGNGKDFIGGAVAPRGLRLTPSAAGAASDFSGLTIGEGVSLSFAGAGKLPANLDATKFASVEIAKGAALDLNGHNLTVARLSGGSSGMLTDSANNYYTAMRDSSGNLYLQLEYLQSSGSQYIDTGYRHNANSVADMKVAVTVAPGNTWYCYYGSRTSEGNQNEFAGWVYKTHHWTGVAGAKGEQTSWSFTVNVPFLVHLDGAANATCSVDGHTFTHSKALTDSGYNDNLFAGRQGSSTPFFAAKAAIYYCTIKEGETVKRDFVAAKRLSDGVLGMLDKENGVFYTNTGSGTFIAGGYTVNSEAAAFGSSGVLRIAVPAGTTLALDDMPLIVGDIKVIKEGAGVLTYNEATSSQKYFLGGYEDATAPVTATWTGAGNDDDFDNADNWTCLDGLGNTVAGAVPDARTTSYILAADADWTSKGEIDIDGATIDLAGHTLKAKGVSGAGLVSDTTNDALAFYKELTYLQSTTVGKQFIDTGYTHDKRANVRVKFSYPVYPSGLEYFSFFGGGERGYAHSFGGWMHRNGSSYNIYRSLGATGADWYGSSAGTVYNLFIRKSTAWDSGNCYVANEANSKVLSSIQKATASDWPSGTTPVTAYLFGHHNLDGTLDGSYAASRIYVCQISDAGTSLRNFVPMKHKVSGKPGMMDKVNNKFYTNANPESTEDFIAGPETAAAAPTATAAEIAAAGTFVIDVDEGDSVNLSSLKLYGKVKLVKTGLGTLVQDAAPECVCGIEVREGTFQTTAALSASIKVDLSIKAGATVSIACAGATSATMPATVSLEAGAKLLFDLADFSAAEFTLASGGFSFGTGATADGCLVVSNPSYGATLASATSISVTLLTAPVTAVWTGLGEARNFDDPGNWSCYNKNGATLSATTLPDDSTTTFRLAADADWTAKGAIALGSGVTLDLNGHNLTAASITGDGVVTDTSSQRWTLLQDVSGNFYAQLEYLASGTSIDNYNHGKEYIDTGYQHNTKTVVDMKVQILKETTDWYCYYGARNGTANAFAGWIYRDNHYKGVTADGSTSTPYPKNVPYLAHMEFGGTCTFGNVEDSSTYLSYTSGAGGSSGRNDFMFALNQGSGNQFGFNGRIYYCTVKEKTDEAGVYHMIRDFVPAQRLSDGVLGMLDKENGVFYVNKGSGAFVAGPYATEGEAAGAGELHITVADGALSLANMAKIAGNVKIVKDGAGTLTLPAAGQYFTGGLEVAGGTLAMTQTAAFLAGTPITATAGGTIEVAAAAGASYANNFTIAGGTLKVVASGTGATTTAAIAGTLALELGANDAQPKVSVDMTDCSSTTFILNTTALTVGEGVTAAPGFVQTPDATFEASIVDGTAIKVERVIAPVTAVWTGAEDDNFDNPANWTCYNKNGATLANTTLPDNTTLTFRLGKDADWTAKGAITLGSGVTLDLAGHTLTADSVTGSGVVIDSSDNFITASDGSVYQKIQYVQATQDGASNSAQNKIQYVDTEYYHIGTTKVDIRVEFQDVSYSGNYGYAVFYGCRDQNNYKTAQLGGWIHNSKFFYYDTGEHDGSTAKTDVIYDVRLDKNGSSYANYEDGTRASTLGTGNGAGSSNTYGTDYIFANNQVPNGGKYWPCKCKVYSCKVYTGDTLERDFVPVRCISGAKAGQAGFWCNVTEKFYGNSGYGSLTAGPVVQSETSGGEFHITVAENATASLGGMAVIAGNVKVVKIGSGTLTLPAAGQYFTGGLEVAGGTLAMTQTPGWMTNATVSATAGGTIEIAAADGASYANDFSLAGGTLKVVASGTGATTTAAIDGTLALSLGADSAQPAVSIDMMDCTSGTFLLNSTALTVGEGVTAAPGFVATPDATMFEASVEDSTIKVDHLTAPVTAEWTGRGQPGNFDDPANWSCYNKKGVALPNTTVPAFDGSTLAISLGANADWTAKGAVTLGAGVTLDLNGQTLAVASITGDGLVIDTSDDSVIVADDGSVYRKIQYVQATQEGANNSTGQNKIQYVDTEYYHVNTTKVDIRVEFQDVAVAYNSSGPWAVYYGCRQLDDANRDAQLGGWIHGGWFWYNEANASVAVKTGTIYDIRLDKNNGGANYANYADGTLASTLGTGNGAGESNTYGTDYIFANNQTLNGGKYWPCKCRVYSCAVYTGDALERDFVPVLCISGAKAGQAGFWCNVTSKFYGNSGYGSLTAGPLAQGATTASELHFTVAEGQTVSLASAPAIVGNVKIVKDGAGTLTLPATGHYFSGGIEVEAGTLSLGGALAYGGAIDAASGVTVSVPASVGSAGTSVIDFADGGVFEIAGCATANVIGAVTLGGGNISITGTFAPVSGSAACAVTLAGTTTLDFTQWTGAFPVAYPALAFASGANITLKVSPETEALTALARTRNAGTGETGGYLFTWSAIPADATIELEAGVGGKFKIEPRAGGIWFRAPVGFKLIVY